jgi:hypothetical protein
MYEARLIELANACMALSASKASHCVSLFRLLYPPGICNEPVKNFTGPSITIPRGPEVKANDYSRE